MPRKHSKGRKDRGIGCGGSGSANRIRQFNAYMRYLSDCPPPVGEGFKILEKRKAAKD